VLKNIVESAILMVGLGYGLAQSPPWQRPEPGWLYIVDGDSLRGDKTSRVLVVDPDRDVVVEQLPVTGYQVALAQSHDGRRLYVVSGPAGVGMLTIIDTTTSQITGRVSVPNRVLVTTLPDSATLAISRDDRWVFVENMKTTVPGVDEYSVSIIDAQNPNRPIHIAPIPSCGVGHLMTESRAWDLLIHCFATNAVRMIGVGPDGAVTRTDSEALPSRPKTDAAKVAAPVATRSATIALEDSRGQISAMMGDGQGVDGAPDVLHLNLDVFASPVFIPMQNWAVTKDGHLLYGGVTPLANAAQHEGKLNQVAVIDLDTRKQTATIPIPYPFFSLALSASGDALFAASPRSGKVVVIDTAQQRINRVLSNVGASPIKVLVSP
jgi:DNA-binding beta-propeller fold protein YncE